MESLTKKRFIKTRRALEETLELDGFCEEISIAFEHQGAQHFREVKFFHREEDSFKKQQIRDEKKRQICRKKNILLIEIPHTVSNKEGKIETYIKKRLPAKFVVGKVNWEKFGTSLKPKLKEIKEILVARNITCLSNVYTGRKTKFDLRCNVCNYEWTTTADCIQDGHGCHQCAGNKKISMEKVLEICEARNIEFLDDKYKNIRTYHNFRCKICIYKWRTTFKCIERAKCCPKCSDKRAVAKRKQHGDAPYKKMWETLRKNYGPTGRRKPRLSKEEWLKRKRANNRRYYRRKRQKMGFFTSPYSE